MMKEQLLIFILITLLCGCIERAETYEGITATSVYSEVTTNDSFLIGILKPEYLGGSGNVKAVIEERPWGTDRYFKDEWYVEGVSFYFVYRPSTWAGGNFDGWSKWLNVSSIDKRFFNSDIYPFLDCDYFDEKELHGYEIEVGRGDGYQMVMTGESSPCAECLRGPSGILDYWGNVSGTFENCSQ